LKVHRKAGKKLKNRQLFSSKQPVVNLVKAVEYIFHRLGISDSVCRNPASRIETFDRVAGMTNTYLKPVRIGRKTALGVWHFFYGLKIDILPSPYEIIPFEAPADIYKFFKNRINKTVVDYISIHKGLFRLDVDIKNGVIVDTLRIGFDDEFTSIVRNAVLTIGDLENIISYLIKTS